jgi:hypothetical protein
MIENIIIFLLRKSSIMKIILTCLILFRFLLSDFVYAQGIFADKTLADGYMITLKGDSIPIKFKLESNLNTGEPTLWCVKEGLKYYDQEGKKKKITVDNTREFGYFIDKKVIRYLCINQFFPNDPFATRMFLKLEINDNLKLYSSTCTADLNRPRIGMMPNLPVNTDRMATNNGSFTATGVMITTEYLLQKGDENPYDVTSFGFRKDLSEYLKEDKELVDKIQNRDLKEKDIVAIVNEYNRWFKYERNAK